MMCNMCTTGALKDILSVEKCLMTGIIFPIIPPGPIKNAPRATKSDCEDLKKSNILLTTSLGPYIKNYAMLSFLSGRLQTSGFLTPF